jgi:hypothetical protein
MNHNNDHNAAAATDLAHKFKVEDTTRTQNRLYNFQYEELMLELNWFGFLIAIQITAAGNLKLLKDE